MTDAPAPAEPATIPIEGDATRIAIVLHLLLEAPGRQLTRGNLNTKLKTKAAAAVGLDPTSAAPLIDRCSAEGYLRTVKAGRTVTYVLEDAGAAHLETLRHTLPAPRVANRRGMVIAAENDDVRDKRVGFLLVEVFKKLPKGLSDGEISKALGTNYAREKLELNVATARGILGDMVERGLVGKVGNGRAALYAMTAEGRMKLANTEFPKGEKITLRGEELNALLEAAREVGKQFTPVEQPDLKRAIQQAFEELLREKHTVTGLVPIHEVRAMVRARIGHDAGQHSVFDEAVLELWREKKVGLTSLPDAAKATPEQIQDAIPGVGETLFYLEVAHVPAYN